MALPACVLPSRLYCQEGRERASARVWFILEFGLRVRSGHDGLKHAQKLNTLTQRHTHTHAQQQQLHMLLAPRTSCLMVKCKQPTAGCILAKPQAHTHSNTPTHSPTHTDTHQSTHTHQHQHRQVRTFTNASSTCPHSRIATNKKKVSKYINI